MLSPLRARNLCYQRPPAGIRIYQIRFAPGNSTWGAHDAYQTPSQMARGHQLLIPLPYTTSVSRICVTDLGYYGILFWVYVIYAYKNIHTSNLYKYK